MISGVMALDAALASVKATRPARATPAWRGYECGQRNLSAAVHLVGSSQAAGQQRPGPREPIMAREPEFKILKNTEGEYFWHLEAASSRVVAWSGRGYVVQEACLDDVYWITGNASQGMN